MIAHSGEAYRQGLIDLVAELGLADVVDFDDRYLVTATLRDQIQQAHLIVLPYVSTEQVTSGVLTEAIGAGKPVVATTFPHAIDVLASGRGSSCHQRTRPRWRPRSGPSARPPPPPQVWHTSRRGWRMAGVGRGSERFDAVVSAVSRPRTAVRACAVRTSVSTTDG